MLVLAAARTLGPRWLALLAAVGALDGISIIGGLVIGLVGAVGTLLSGLALYQKAKADAHAAEREKREAERDHRDQRLAEALESLAAAVSSPKRSD